MGRFCQAMCGVCLLISGLMLPSAAAQISWHSGLLGKRWAGFDFVVADNLTSSLQPSPGGGFLSNPSAKSSLTGYQLDLNQPIWQAFDCNVDLFARAAHSEFDARRTVASDFSPVLIDREFHVAQTQLAIGATVWRQCRKIRPFGRIGYGHRFESLETPGEPPGALLPVFAPRKIETDSPELILDIGAELDVATELSLRTIVEFAPHHNFQDGSYAAELIYWPTDSLFLKSGLLGDLGGNTIGGVFGLGVSF